MSVAILVLRLQLIKSLIKHKMHQQILTVYYPPLLVEVLVEDISSFESRYQVLLEMGQAAYHDASLNSLRVHRFVLLEGIF